jgi:hypothetical protein
VRRVALKTYIESLENSRLARIDELIEEN